MLRILIARQHSVLVVGDGDDGVGWQRYRPDHGPDVIDIETALEVDDNRARQQEGLTFELLDLFLIRDACRPARRREYGQKDREIEQLDLSAQWLSHGQILTGRRRGAAKDQGIGYARGTKSLLAEATTIAVTAGCAVWPRIVATVSNTVVQAQ